MENFMKNILFEKEWNWKISGIALGLVFLIAIIFVKPIGVSTQFVILDGIIWNTFSDDIATPNVNTSSGYSSSNAYLNKSGGKYAKNIANPLNYSFIFVLAMALGGFAAFKMQSQSIGNQKIENNDIRVSRYWDSPTKRYIAAFVGGFLALLGARIAGGCTSGHMMSGIMQTSLSGYLFTLGAFIIAVPVAIFLYKEGK
jgi:hypothetical protein